MSGQGLAVSPGTLANSPKRFVPLFEPMAEAILAHQSKAALRHADETSWRVQELRGEARSSRAWLWTSVSSDAVCFHIDPSRSAEAAHKLFAEALPSSSFPGLRLALDQSSTPNNTQGGPTDQKLARIFAAAPYSGSAVSS